MSAPASTADLALWRGRCAAAAAAGLVLCAAGGAANGPQFFRSWLCAYMFWFGLGAGCLGLLMLHYVVGGEWGELLRPMLEAGAATMPWLALLFVPLLPGLPALYPWARAAEVAAQPLLQHKHPYLNAPFFLLRAAACFALWCWLTRRLRRRPGPEDKAGAAAATRLAAAGLVLYFLTMTFCILDWTMSLEPLWYSTVYELILIAGQAVSALAFALAALVVIGDGRRLRELMPDKAFVDVGNLLLACIMLWAYAEFSQYLIIWSGGIPVEIAWYLRRQHGGWFPAGLVMIAVLFAAPFLALLVRENKARVERLAVIAGVLVAGRVLELFWLIKPAFPTGPAVHWLDAAAALAIGGTWLAVFLGRLMSRPFVRETAGGLAP